VISSQFVAVIGAERGPGRELRSAADLGVSARSNFNNLWSDSDENVQTAGFGDSLKASSYSNCLIIKLTST
jgi:hypothetical protein